MTVLGEDMLERAERAQRLARGLDVQSFYDLFSVLVDCSSILKTIAPVKRKPWLSHVIEELYQEQNGRCALCDEPLDGAVHVDHKVPFCYGGGGERANIQLAHGKCNQQKGNSVSAEDLLRYLEDRAMNL